MGEYGRIKNLHTIYESNNQIKDIECLVIQEYNKCEVTETKLTEGNTINIFIFSMTQNFIITT